MINESSPSPRHVPGLDTLRFAAAIWVAFSHGARLPMDKLVPTGPFAFWAQSINNATFDGVAAVMVFFVLSGLLIHLPQVETNTVKLVPYLTRRLLRILPPFYISMIVGNFLDVKLDAVHIIIYWSVYCETCYYVIYPLMLIGFRRFGMLAILVASAVIACTLIGFHWQQIYWDQLNIFTAAAIGLPCWLLGCLLATRLRDLKPVTWPVIWGWRLMALILSMGLKVPVTHGPLIIGYPASHWLFALFAFLWIQREIAWFRVHPPVRFFEWMGSWSYSIYLMHGFVIAAFARFNGVNPMTWWALQLFTILYASYCFYLAAEGPAHYLARHIGSYFKRPHREESDPVYSFDS